MTIIWTYLASIDSIEIIQLPDTRPPDHELQSSCTPHPGFAAEVKSFLLGSINVTML